MSNDKIIESMNLSSEKSPLAILGINDDGPSLLDEKLSEVRSDNRPGFPGSKDFGEAKRESHSLFDKMKDEAFSAELPGSTKQEDPEDEDDDEAEAAPKQDDMPDWFHSVNNEQVQLRQRQENFEAQTRQTQELLQQIAHMQNQRQAPEEEIDYEGYGFESAQQYKQYEQALTNKIQQQVYQAQAPLFQQLAFDRFQSAMAQAQNNHENFSRYFPKEKLNAYYTELSRKISPQQMAAINWEAEWGNAYKASDYERLKRDYQAMAEKEKAIAESKGQDRTQQKKALKVVPKASHQGASARGGLHSEIDKLSPKLSFNQFGREFKKLSSLG